MSHETSSFARLFFFGGEAAPLGDAVTIDRSPNDAALAAVRNCFPGHGDHAGNQEAFQNLNRFFGGGQGEGVIVGHGNQGLIVTNKAAGQYGNNDWMTCNNWDFWRNLATSLRGHTTFTKLIACHVGAADVGAALLWELAVFTNAPVSGPTGLVYPNPNGTITYEPGSVWQVATPGPNPPAAIPAPQHQIMALGVTVDLQFRSPAGMFTVPLRAVTSVVYHRGPSRGAEARILSLVDGAGLLRLIDFGHPFNPGGPPLALTTGHLDVAFTVEDGSEHTRSLVIYNDRLVHEPQGDTYYYVNSTFPTVVATAI
jgi:hypothetical protein